MLSIILFLYSLFLIAPNHTYVLPDYKETRLYVIENSEFSEEFLKEYVGLIEVNHKNIVIAKSMLETGNYTSKIFKENNNLFGMKRPLIRPNLVTGSRRGHATYNHWTDSVKDYVLWYEYFTQFNPDYTNYLQFLILNNYAEDPAYIRKLNYIIANL